MTSATTGHDEPGHVSTGQLPAPERARTVIDAAHERYRGVREGTVASYIPALAAVDPGLFGVSVVGGCCGSRRSPAAARS